MSWENILYDMIDHELPRLSTKQKLHFIKKLLYNQTLYVFINYNSTQLTQYWATKRNFYGHSLLFLFSKILEQKFSIQPLI